MQAISASAQPERHRRAMPSLLAAVAQMIFGREQDCFCGGMMAHCACRQNVVQVPSFHARTTWYDVVAHQGLELPQ